MLPNRTSLTRLGDVPTVEVRGRLQEVVGTLIKASGVQAKIGEWCELVTPGLESSSYAEVVGFYREQLLLMPMQGVAGLSSATQVIPTGRTSRIAVGDEILGRVLNGLGEPMDGLPLSRLLQQRSCIGQPPNPLARNPIDEVLPTGVRVIDALMTVGVGQRIGLFAPAGVGKSTLLGMLARGAASDVNVIALIGERGREVREFIEQTLGEEGLRKSVVIVATSDRSAIERMKAAYAATSIAEHFRDQGKRVLLLMDSLTRFARAQREVGLASGEPPTRRGYPPSLFAELPRLLERSGCNENGSITAFYTVLTEGEDQDDPIAEEVRSILDGHIVMSRKLAEKNYYPAIDVLASLSRIMGQVTSARHQQHAAMVRRLEAKYRDIELLVQIGEYQAGADSLADEALMKHELVKQLLIQATDDFTDFDRILAELEHIAQADTAQESSYD
jgi:type III secretion protein N (ATPase)